MNPNLSRLHSYPFEKLGELTKGTVSSRDKPHIALSLGEPQHSPPHFISEAIIAHLHSLTKYPTTWGTPELRDAIALWLAQRFNIAPESIDSDKHILPVCGTREALFSFAQCVVDPNRSPVVIMPNPFYQIYEGAALLAGAKPYYINTKAENGFLPDFEAVPKSTWSRCQLLYICSPSNPSGAVISQPVLQHLIELAQRYDFLIASDECYSEIYSDETNPPPGLLQAANTMGNDSFDKCIAFHSLSKRSNAPGLRSGFVAGDAEVLKSYLQYRTYQGNTMPHPTQLASIRAWSDESHVRENRALYKEKFETVARLWMDVWPVEQPAATFYLWPKTPISDTEFARRLYAQENVTVLPGSFLSRDIDGLNPGKNRVRIALVQPLEECIDAALRIKQFIGSL